MSPILSRRDFLKVSGLGISSLAFRPKADFTPLQDGDALIRIANTSTSVYSKPDENSKINFQRFRDEVVNVYYEVESDKPPKYNPLWYRVWGGYIHCARVQKVSVKINSVPAKLSEGIHLAEVTVPYSQSYLLRKQNNWTQLYRLYYGSVHWVIGIVEGPDGEPWYRIRDEMLKYDTNLDYYVPAKHMRLVDLTELTPISPDVPPDKKYIEVSLSKQELTAYEGDKIVMHTKISSGLDYTPPGETTWKTPTGKFVVQTKMPSKHMGGGQIVFNPEAYIIPGVPWVSFFEPETGVAFHGTYWHQNYGIPMSHGCINMKPEEAKWIFRWVTPKAEMTKMTTTGYGTQVLVY
jgi:lipoprotein-anchoring transpeptidase ErfK/SrfK